MRHQLLLLVAISFLFLALPGTSQSQNLIINGSFEITTVPGCTFGLPNATFTTSMTGCTGAGPHDHMDVMNTPTGCGFLGPPQDGNVKIRLSTSHHGYKWDGFTFLLTSPVVAGQTYTVSFWAWREGPVVNFIRLALSNDANDAIGGAVILDGTPGTSGWTKFETTFLAPSSASHLAVRISDCCNSTRIHIDNFVLEHEDSIPTNQTTWGLVKSLFR